MNNTASEQEIQAWLTSYLVELLDVEPDKVDVQKQITRYGLDSSAIMSLLGDLETWLDCELPVKVINNNSTIATISHQIHSIISTTTKK